MSLTEKTHPPFTQQDKRITSHFKGDIHLIQTNCSGKGSAAQGLMKLVSLVPKSLRRTVILLIITTCRPG